MATGRIWPTSLPQHPLSDNYQESAPSRLLRTSMEGGVAKVRRLASVLPWKRQESYIMDDAQLATFKSFVSATLSDGALRFDRANPISGVIEEIRIVPQSEALYTIVPFGSVDFRVSLVVEVLP